MENPGAVPHKANIRTSHGKDVRADVVAFASSLFKNKERKMPKKFQKNNNAPQYSKNQPRLVKGKVEVPDSFDKSFANDKGSKTDWTYSREGYEAHMVQQKKSWLRKHPPGTATPAELEKEHELILSEEVKYSNQQTLNYRKKIKEQALANAAKTSIVERVGNAHKVP
jgi:hypothetical protein